MHYTAFTKTKKEFEFNLQNTQHIRNLQQNSINRSIQDDEFKLYGFYPNTSQFLIMHLDTHICYRSLKLHCNEIEQRAAFKELKLMDKISEMIWRVIISF